MSRNIVSYLLFTGLFFVSLCLLKIHHSVLLLGSLWTLLFMACFFNCFLLYKKSRVLFCLLYLLPLLGIGVSLTSHSPPEKRKGVRPKTVAHALPKFRTRPPEESLLLPPMKNAKEAALIQCEGEEPSNASPSLPLPGKEGVSTFTPKQAAGIVPSLNPEWIGTLTSSQTEVYAEAALPPARCRETRTSLNDGEQFPYSQQWEIACERDGTTRVLTLFAAKNRKNRLEWSIRVRDALVPCSLTWGTGRWGKSSIASFGLDTLESWFYACEDGRPLLFISYQVGGWYADLYFSFKDGEMLYHGSEYVSEQAAAAM